MIEVLISLAVGCLYVAAREVIGRRRPDPRLGRLLLGSGALSAEKKMRVDFGIDTERFRADMERWGQAMIERPVTAEEKEALLDSVEEAIRKAER